MRSDEIIRKVIGPSVLDVGCAGHEIKPASKYWLHGMLLERFPKLYGFDLNPENILRMRAFGYENVSVANAESFRLNMSFDTIVAGEVIEHLTNPGLFLDRCREHLNPNGRVVVSTPNVFALLYILYAVGKYPKTCQNSEHALWFCPATLEELGRRHGFEIQEWELIEDYEFDNPSLRYRIFARLMTTLGRLLLPGRLRKNGMLFVFRLADNAQGKSVS